MSEEKDIPEEKDTLEKDIPEEKAMSEEKDMPEEKATPKEEKTSEETPPVAEAVVETAKPKSRRKKDAKNVPHAIVYIKNSFNNTVVTFTDKKGNVISWSSSGQVGFRGSRKSTSSAAQLAAEAAGNKAMGHGVKKIDVKVRGPGSGRETAVRTLQNMGLEVTGITDTTPLPHNGCRQPKRRRV